MSNKLAWLGIFGAIFGVATSSFSAWIIYFLYSGNPEKYGGFWGNLTIAGIFALDLLVFILSIWTGIDSIKVLDESK